MTAKAVDGSSEPQSYDSPLTHSQALPCDQNSALFSTTPPPLLPPQPPSQQTELTPRHSTQLPLDEHSPEGYAEGSVIVYAQAVPTAPTAAECSTPARGEAPQSLLLDRDGRPRTWNASTGQWTYNAAAPALHGAPAPLMATAAWGYTYCGPHQQQPPPPQFFPYAQSAVGSCYAPCPCAGVLPPWLVAPPVWSVHPGAIPVAPVVVVLPLLFCGCGSRLGVGGESSRGEIEQTREDDV